MKEFYLLENPIQNYDWGHAQWLSDFLGKTNPGEKPEAELWMGAHPKSSSLVVGVPTMGDKTPLEVLCRENPSDWLGKGTILPYLVKVLAVDKPLSIQVHPDKATAIAGFAAEENAGIDINASSRNYKDPNRKAEIICALTPFYGLCGFLPASKIMKLFKGLSAYMTGAALEYVAEASSILKNEGYLGLIKYFLSVRTSGIDVLIRGLKKYSQTLSLVQAFIINRITRAYPADPAVLFTLALNPVHLNPGEAIFLPTGILHAYVYGLGVELMSNSDNVLRGGLTVKHIDIPELLRVTVSEAYTPVILQKGHKEKGRIFSFPCPVEEFTLHQIDSFEEKQSFAFKSAAIILCTNGALELAGSRQNLTLTKGQAAFVPGPGLSVTFSGTGNGFAASASR